MATSVDDVKNKATLVVGDVDKAEKWLNSPLPVLNGRTPLSVLKDESGYKQIEVILFKIETGDFS